jgi:hypothetical protein
MAASLVFEGLRDSMKFQTIRNGQWILDSDFNDQFWEWPLLFYVLNLFNDLNDEYVFLSQKER